MSRKYNQRGYQDEGKREKPRGGRRGGGSGHRREGPRSPKMTGFQAVMRCSMCGATLSLPPDEIQFSSSCPHCSSALHTCKNCVFFDPGSRFECTQPIPERITPKDGRNSCTFFEARTTVEKMVSSKSKSTLDPRDAFENLFKK